MTMGVFGNNESGSRFGPQLIVALLLAIGGLVAYFGHTSVNPVTGEKQHITLTAAQETQLGLQSAPKMEAEMGGAVPPSEPQAQLVAEVGARVARSSVAHKSPYEYHFHLLADDQTINAFALPGGQVFITRGLLNKLADEAELAGVLGHEIGHVVNRHAAEHMAKAQLGQALVMATAVAGTDRRDDRSSGAIDPALIAGFVNQMAQLKFSRSDESEADQSGLEYMTESGYDPAAMLDVMKVLEEASKGHRQPQILVTHPYPEVRMQKIQQYLAKNFPNGVPKTLTRGRTLRPGSRSGQHSAD